MSTVLSNSLVDLYKPVFGIDRHIVLWLGFTFRELFLQIFSFVLATISTVLKVDFKLTIPWEICFAPMFIADFIIFVAVWVLYRKQNCEMSTFENINGKFIYPDWYRSANGYETTSFKILSWLNFRWKTFTILSFIAIKLILMSMLNIFSEQEKFGDPNDAFTNRLVIEIGKSRLVFVGLIGIILTATLTCADMQDWNPKSSSSTQRRRSRNNSN